MDAASRAFLIVTPYTPCSRRGAPVRSQRRDLHHPCHRTRALPCYREAATALLYLAEGSMLPPKGRPPCSSSLESRASQPAPSLELLHCRR
jgi:hypothetical protein